MYDSPIRYDLYDMYLCIERFMSTNDMPLWYETFCTRYESHMTLRPPATRGSKLASYVGCPSPFHKKKVRIQAQQEKAPYV